MQAPTFIRTTTLRLGIAITVQRVRPRLPMMGSCQTLAWLDPDNKALECVALAVTKDRRCRKCCRDLSENVFYLYTYINANTCLHAFTTL